MVLYRPVIKVAQQGDGGTWLNKLENAVLIIFITQTFLKRMVQQNTQYLYSKLFYNR